MLRDVHCVLVKAGVGRVRAEVLEKRLAEFGAHIQEQPAPTTTHIFAAVPFASLSKYLKTPVNKTARFYTLDWLTESIRQGKPMGADEYLLPASPGWTSSSSMKTEVGMIKMEQKGLYSSRGSKGHVLLKSEQVKSEIKIKNQVDAAALMASLRTHSMPPIKVELRYSPPPSESGEEGIENIKDEYDDVVLPTQSEAVQRGLAFLHSRRLTEGSASSVEPPRLSGSSHSPTLSLSPKKIPPAAAGVSSDEPPAISPRLSPLSPDRDLSQIYSQVTQQQQQYQQHDTRPTLTLDPDERPETDDEFETHESTDKEENEKKRKQLCAYTDVKPWMARKRKAFACQRPSSAPPRVNHNETLTKLLGQLEESAKSTGDKWRAYSYRKAITIIRNQPRPLRTAEEARQLRGIGESIAEKIAEILATGRLRKAENQDDFTRACEIFSKVWGAGPETIKKWYSCGYRTLADLREAPTAALTSQQRIGLAHYDDFLLRIPRAEVAAIETKVLAAARSLVPDVRVVTCGSYRRGRPDCGDVDILLSNTSGSSLHGFLPALVKRLHSTGLLTDDLSHTEKDDQDKYFGVCRLSPAHPYRRLDFQLIPASEWPFALLYFTGSDHFNRSMRLWAKKNNMSLSEKSLVRRLSEDMKGAPLPGITSEEDIFTALGLSYIPPEERNA